MTPDLTQARLIGVDWDGSFSNALDNLYRLKRSLEEYCQNSYMPPVHWNEHTRTKLGELQESIPKLTINLCQNFDDLEPHHAKLKIILCDDDQRLKVTREQIADALAQDFARTFSIGGLESNLSEDDFRRHATNFSPYPTGTLVLPEGASDRDLPFRGWPPGIEFQHGVYDVLFNLRWDSAHPSSPLFDPYQFGKRDKMGVRNALKWLECGMSLLAWRIREALGYVEAGDDRALPAKSPASYTVAPPIGPTAPVSAKELRRAADMETNEIEEILRAYLFDGDRLTNPPTQRKMAEELRKPPYMLEISQSTLSRRLKNPQTKGLRTLVNTMFEDRDAERFSDEQ